jgi:hypothetical protein
MGTTPLTAIARSRRTEAGLTVELVDLAGDDEVLGRVRAALPPGRGAVLEVVDTNGATGVVDRLFAALADELRAIGRRRLTRVLDDADGAERRLLVAQGFVELRRDGEVVAMILDL